MNNKTLALAGLGLALALLAGCGREAPTYSPGSVTVTSDPAGATILLDGRDTGFVTPHTFGELEADLYRFSVELADHVAAPGEIPVDLAPLDDVTVAFSLSQTALFVTSDPVGAAILLDGADTGEVTPATLVGLAAGSHAIALSLDTYLVSPASFNVDVAGGVVDSLAVGTFSLRPRRTVILEGFGNTDCPPCPELTDNLVSLASQPGLGPDRLLYLEFSVSWPNPADPLFLYNQQENADRYTKYFVLGAPALYANGVEMDDALDLAAVRNEVAAALLVDPGFRIDVAADFTGSLVPVAVTLDPATDVDLSGHVLYVALYEKVIDFTARGLAAGSNGQKVFHHVFRDRSDSVPTLATLTAGTPQTHEFGLVRGDWPLDNLAVVAFVQRESDLQILQAGSYGETPHSKGNPR